MKHLILSLLVLGFVAAYSQSDEINIHKVEPPFWWTGMKNQNLQLLVYGNNIGLTEPSIEYPGLVYLETTRVENPNYLFIRFSITDACKPGTFKIRFMKDGKEVLVRDYTLKARAEGSSERKGFDRTDGFPDFYFSQ